VWVIVIAREASGTVEIHRYLNRLSPPVQFDDTIRLIEQSWRAFEAGQPLFEDEAIRLLARPLDPLALCMLGYRLARENKQELLNQVVQRLALADIADRHVLASMLGDRDAHMQQAITSSPPIIGEGYRLMEAWLIDHYAAENLPPPAPPEPFSGAVWTSFDTRATAVISKAFPIVGAPAWANVLLHAAAATARVERRDHGSRFIGTGFLIGPRALATADVVVDDLQVPHAANFGGSTAVLEKLVASSKRHHAALVRIEAVEGLPALAIRWALPRIGQRIAVIGHPALSFSPTLVTIAAFTTPPAGEKMIMPGVIVAVADDRLTYECWTMAGVAGGPVVDLATGEVIGIHHSGKYEGGAKKLGWGTPMSAIRELLETPIQADL
jgi:hypothetical protein